MDRNQTGILEEQRHPGEFTQIAMVDLRLEEISCQHASGLGRFPASI
jgi:hypothetical protein